jgi:transcriptional pleiotropic regulator of transition state genes
MKEKGIVRSVDNLGRVVVPKEIRKTMKIDVGEPLEVFVQENMICLKKHNSYKNYIEMLEELSRWLDGKGGNTLNVNKLKKKIGEVIALMETERKANGD